LPFQAGHFTVNPDLGEGSVDWKSLSAQYGVEERGCVRHLRFASPLSVLMSGRSNPGMIFKPHLTPQGSSAGDYFLDIGYCTRTSSLAESLQ
jgi:hypothetical protein